MCQQSANVFIYGSLDNVTIVRDDSPGGEGGVQASQHPEHAEPTQMFSTLIHLQELGEVGVHDRDGSPNSVQERYFPLQTMVPSYTLSIMACIYSQI